MPANNDFSMPQVLHTRFGSIAAWVLGACLWSGCGGEQPAKSRAAELPSSPTQVAEAGAIEPATSLCPEVADAPVPLPGVRPHHTQLEYWLSRAEEAGDLDRPLMSAAEIASHNKAMLPGPELREGVAREAGSSARYDLLSPVHTRGLKVQLNRRLEFLQLKFQKGSYLNGDGSKVAGKQLDVFRTVETVPPLVPELRIALAAVPIRCAPRPEGYYTKSLDHDFDRNLCATAQPQEVVQVLAAWNDGMVLARTSYALGWIDVDAPISPPVSHVSAEHFLSGPHIRAGQELEIRTAAGQTIPVPFGSLLPELPGGQQVWIATSEGTTTGAPVEVSAAASSRRPLTRRTFLTDAFAYLDQPYGWGGYKGGRDCSRFLMDLFAGFGLQLPRHSSHQAVSGPRVIDVPEHASRQQRLRILDEAERGGIALMHFPGHIMLYLGRDESGVPMALHSFAEYIKPCSGRAAGAAAGNRETLMKVGRVTVTDL
ncbi:MAG: NlpC/P60 family protein, partial [Nannocystaceae bacterium]